MLASFNSSYDYGDFEKKLRHYFTDTAPIYAQIRLSLGEVFVSNGRYAIQITIDGNIGVKDNIKRIIKCCEQSLYPKMINIEYQPIFLSDSRKEELVLQGFTVEQILQKQTIKKWKMYIITRFNISRDSIDYKEESTNKVFRAHFNRPLVISRDIILKLSEENQEGMQKLYHLITENSKIEELEEDYAPVS